MKVWVKVAAHISEVAYIPEVYKFTNPRVK
jgi:hypothetical protein